VIPQFMNWAGHMYNDRMFYGIWKYVKAWSTSRFDLVPQYLMTPKSHIKKDQLHSESFMFYLLDTLEIPVISKPMCFWRVRADSYMNKRECTIGNQPINREVFFSKLTKKLPQVNENIENKLEKEKQKKMHTEIKKVDAEKKTVS